MTFLFQTSFNLVTSIQQSKPGNATAPDNCKQFLLPCLWLIMFILPGNAFPWIPFLKKNLIHPSEPKSWLINSLTRKPSLVALPWPATFSKSLWNLICSVFIWLECEPQALMYTQHCWWVGNQTSLIFCPLKFIVWYGDRHWADMITPWPPVLIIGIMWCQRKKGERI